MAEPSVAENTPPMMPPMTTMIREREGRARRVQTPRFFQSNLPGVPLYPSLTASSTPTTQQHSAQMMPGM